MKNIFLIFLLLNLFSCGSNSDMYQSEYYQNEETKKDCLKPENPYSEGNGHYAGFEWALNNGGSCSGNSNSFIEGCEEYYSQEDDYENCTK